MTDNTSLLALGDLAWAERNSLSEAAQATDLALRTTRSIEEASSWLDEYDPCALLLGSEDDAPLSLVLEARAQKRHRQLPILALARDPSDLEFADAFSWGADDVVAPDKPWSLTLRLRALARQKPQSIIPPRGTAVVAEVDQNRRVATARVLSNAGFEVQFAVTPEDARTFALQPDVRLVVICTEFCQEPEQLIDSAVALGSQVHFVVSAEPKRYLELSSRLGSRPDARVTDASAPPENVVFLANELAAGPLLDKRTAVRTLYGTTVRFRAEGLEEDELGFSYNVSVGGLYVRTLAPPTEDLVWLELTPPHTARRVRLVGQVAWRRPFGPNGNATVPPGFGVRIVDGSRADLVRWTEACAAR